MNVRFLFLSAAAIASALLAPRTASACGGCFHEENQGPEQISVVTAHRMALSISTERTVLWDQVQFAGNPAEFAWVLPVRPGAYIEPSKDAWFEALDAATTTRVFPPPLSCGGSSGGFGCASTVGCSASDGEGLVGPDEPDPVEVVHHGSVGPYETVTLHSDTPGALPDWLDAHGYALPDDIAPVVDAYVAEGFDFIALRLLPTAGIQQMEPVRVISPGASPVLPLRMVAAGVGANVAITLFVIGEGRWVPKNFPVARIDERNVVWDFAVGASNYTSLMSSVMASGEGRTWVESFSEQRALLSFVYDLTYRDGALVPQPVSYNTGFGLASSIAEAYVLQGISNGDLASVQCAAALKDKEASGARVVDTCAGLPESAPCPAAEKGTIDARTFGCGDLTDLSTALTGLHPKDVWLTRLDANLPSGALAEELELEAAGVQDWKDAQIISPEAANAPCASGFVTPVSSSEDKRRELRDRTTAVALAALGLLAAGAFVRRRGRGAMRARASA